MGDKAVTVTVDPINKGIDRYDTDIRRGKIVEGLNVINDDGDLRRRDALKSLYTAAPHFLPPGLVQVYFSDGAGSGEVAALQATRSGTITTSHSRIYVGCEEKFDGIDFSVVTPAAQSPTHPPSSKVFFANALSGWSEIDWFLDTTKKLHGSSGELTVPWSQNGRISWHPQDIVDHEQTWTPNNGAIGAGGCTLGLARDGTTKLYWIALEVRRHTSITTMLPPTANIVITAPGIRCFKLSRVNGLFPIRTKGKSMTVVCSDRMDKRGSERGAMIGSVVSASDPTKQVNLIGYSSADRTLASGNGVMGQLTWPDYQKAAASPVENVPSYSADGVGPTTTGAANKMTRMKQSTQKDWFAETDVAESEWRGGRVIEIASGKIQGGGATTTTKVKYAVTDNPGLEDAFANQFEHHLLRFISGETDEEERMIYKNTAAVDAGGTKYMTFYVDDAYSTTPDGNAVIYRPHCRLRMEPSENDYEVQTNDENTISPLNGSGSVTRPWAPAPTDGDGTTITAKPVHFFVGPSPRWSIESGDMYSAVFNIASQTVLLSNGRSSLMTFDGKDLKVLIPHSDSSTDFIAALYSGLTGHSDEQIKHIADGGFTEKGKLKSNPLTGENLSVFQDHVFISNTEGREFRVVYSGGHNAAHIWPQGYAFFARDEESRRIQGMRSMGSGLAIWTASNIMGFRFGKSDDERMVPQVLSRGLGFLSHAGVQSVRGALVGPNTDGLYAFRGGQSTALIDDWNRIIKGGINAGRLSRATAVNLYHKAWYVLAIASAGSDKNDRLVVWDYARNQLWLWSAPYGASFLARDLDENGSEILLVGTDDGYVQTLCGNEKDDGQAIESYARTPPINPFGPAEAALVEVQVTAENAASTEPMVCKIFVSKREAESTSINLSLDASQSSLTSFVLDTATTGDDRYKTKKASLNAKGHDFQVQVGGAYQWRLRRIFVTTRDLGKR